MSCAIVVSLFIGIILDANADMTLKPSCQTYCDDGVYSLHLNLCNSYIPYGVCSMPPIKGIDNTFSSYSVQGISCTVDQCPEAGLTVPLSMGTRCYYSNRSLFNATTQSCPCGFVSPNGATCYSISGSLCLSGAVLTDRKCHVPRIDACEVGYKRVGNTERCVRGIAPTTIMSAAQCGYESYSTAHCAWCSGD